LSSSSPTTSEGRATAAKADEFERSVLQLLRSQFEKVESKAGVQGYSGITWRVDALVNDCLVVEVSMQKRLETKINSTFLRFVDITRRNPQVKAALVFEDLYVGYHHSLGKKFFPTSEYRTMIQHGFPILTPLTLPQLVNFMAGKANALEVSSKPSDFNARSIFQRRRKIGEEILEVLKEGPKTPREIARATGRSPIAVRDAVRTIPVKRLSTYYALTEEEICRKLAQRGGKVSSAQRKIARDWLKKQFLIAIREKGHCRTQGFAAALGISDKGMTYLIHDLIEDGLVRNFGKGDWGLADPPGQARL